MEQPNTPLPTPRHLLTSLINTLTTPPQTAPTNEPYSVPTNPLKSLPPSHRALLTTLHVLFPTGMLLQSLDLLDRGLVTRVTLSLPSNNQQPSSTDRPENTEVPDRPIFPPQAHIHLPPSLRDLVQKNEAEGEGKRGVEGRKNTIYKVTSSQPLKSRFSHSGAGSGQMYTVRLGAWNCSCAAFAFSAFPGASGTSYTSTTSLASGTGSKPWETIHEEEFDREGAVGGGEGEEEWEFGGMSFDGKEGEGVPVCKHLLACLLGDRWGDVVGGLVKEREVGREEMGGLGAD